MKTKPVILIVDDQPQNIELLEVYLIPQGYEIVKASSGEEALEKLVHNKIDLVLLDVMMPKMSGFEVLEKLRADEKTRLIPVVMVTALKETEDRVKALEAGCDDFISKPFDKSELIARIKSLLRIKSMYDKVKEATEAKSKFTSMVSHELRSPLTVIKESINVVLEGLLGSVTPEQKDILDTAKSNADRLGRLINNVLDFQKIEAGKLSLNIKECDMNEIVLATSKGMNFLAEEKGMSFTVNVDDSIPRTKFDKDKIIQVLTNLLSNAVKFTEKGSISITTKREDDVMHVMVEDTGLGIQATDMPKLFQAFGQLSGGLEKNRGGTGLGLAISKEIIQAHNGKIWAESKLGIGSTFHFTLPIKESRD
jgi:two-component system sensor histidine kinase/response regulator